MTEPLSTDQPFLRKLTDLVIANLQNQNFGVNELALESGLNRRVLNRKLRKITGKSCSRFIRDVRLQKALVLLMDGIYTVAEVGYKAGFNSPVYFTKCFHEYFGYPPGKVKIGDLTDSEFKKLSEKGIEKRSSGKLPERLATYRAGIVIFIVLIVSGVFFIFNRIKTRDWTDDLSSPDGSISIAVMPFQNLTQDTTWNIWQEGIQGRFISNLANNPSSKVRPQDIINTLLRVNGQENYASISPSVMRNISRKIDANLYVYGTITEANSITSVDAQLISSRTNEVIKSFKMEGHLGESDAFLLADTLSTRLLNFLLISMLASDRNIFDVRSIYSKSLLPGSAEEFRYCYYGNKALMKGENELAISWYKKALAIDSNDFAPMIGLSSAYGNSGQLEESYKWVLKYYSIKDRWPVDQQIYSSWAYAYSFEPPEEGIKYLKQLQDLSGIPIKGYLLGYCYCKIQKYYEAIPEFENYLKMSERFGKEFLENNWAFPHLAEAYNKTGQYRKERKIIRKWEKYNPEDLAILHQKASLALSEGDSAAARKHIEKYTSENRRRNKVSEADINESVGRIYYDSGIMDMAEYYYRQAVDLDPGNPARLFRFASFLTETERKLDDVPAYMDRAMKFARNRVDYYNYLDQKGWSLYKQGKYSEALAIIEKAWTEAPFKLYTINHHLEMARKTVNIQR
jgi:AraC-like DNA-binding protein/tetratricopeptide (TPR) repeat protein